MTLHHFIDGVDVTNRVEFGTLTDIQKAAFGGERGGGKVTITDRLGSLNLVGWHAYYAEDDACSQPRIFTGSLKGRRISRGPEGPIGAGRVWECDLNDLNERAHRKILRGAIAKRPAESQAARIAWLLASVALSGLVADTGYVTPDAAHDLDASDERKRFPDEVLDEMTPWRGQNWFFFWDPGAAAVSLFLDLQTTAILNSTIKISNVAGDLNEAALVFATGASVATDDGVLDRSPDEVYGGIELEAVGISIYRTRPATIAAFVDRDFLYESTAIGNPATAEAVAASFLASHADEKDELTIPVRLPASAIGLIDAGYRVQIKQEHLPGYESAYVWTRVKTMTLSQAVEFDHYDVVLVCTNAAPRTGPGGGGTGGFPHPPAGPAGFVQSATRLDGGLLTPTPANPTDGNALFLWLTERGTATYPATPAGWTSVATAKNLSAFADNYYARLVRKIASGDTAASLATAVNVSSVGATFMEWTGTFGAEVHQSDQNVASSAVPLTCGGAITPSAANAIVVGCGVVGTFGTTSVAPNTGVTELSDLPFPSGNAPTNWVGYKALTTAASTTIGGTMTGRKEFGGVTFTVLPSAPSNPPSPTQQVGPETVTMTGANGTTAFPFADGSLKVYVDNVNETAAITAQNGAAGTFTLGFSPTPTESVVVYYQGR